MINSVLKILRKKCDLIRDMNLFVSISPSLKFCRRAYVVITSFLSFKVGGRLGLITFQPECVLIEFGSYPILEMNFNSIPAVVSISFSFHYS